MPDKIVQIKLLKGETHEAVEAATNQFLIEKKLLTEDFLSAHHTMIITKEAQGGNLPEFCHCMTIIYRVDVL